MTHKYSTADGFLLGGRDTVSTLRTNVPLAEYGMAPWAEGSVCGEPGSKPCPFVVLVWSSTLSSKKTNCSQCWGNSIPLRKLRSHLRLTLRRPPPPLPSKNPKPNPKSTEDGNSGSFRTRGERSPTADSEPTRVKSILFPRRIGRRTPGCRRGRPPLLALRTKKGLCTKRSPTAARCAGPHLAGCSSQLTGEGSKTGNRTYTVQDAVKLRFPSSETCKNYVSSLGQGRLSLCTQLKLIVIFKPLFIFF